LHLRSRRLLCALCVPEGGTGWDIGVLCPRAFCRASFAAGVFASPYARRLHLGRTIVACSAYAAHATAIPATLPTILRNQYLRAHWGRVLYPALLLHCARLGGVAWNTHMPATLRSRRAATPSLRNTPAWAAGGILTISWCRFPGMTSCTYHIVFYMCLPRPTALN